MASKPMVQDFVYGEVVNTELLALVGPLSGRVLDVGCGAGAWAESLRRAGGQTLVGIEPAPEAAAIARERYDAVVEDALESVDLARLGGQPFDHVIVADVLEHLVDPWAALRRFREWSSPAATLAVSVPNSRYYRLSLALLLGGRFTYARSGVMDWTHLRWFTQASLDRSLRVTGWEPQHWGWAIGSGKRQAIARLLGGATNSLLAAQLRVVAVPS